MEDICALIANDPRVYREAISGAPKRLRPLIEVSMAGPESWTGRRGACGLTRSSSAGAAPSCGTGLCWVVSYPDGEDRAEIGAAGVGRTMHLAEAGVDDLGTRMMGLYKRAIPSRPEVGRAVNRLLRSTP